MTTTASRGAVVVGYDGTEQSDAALDWGARYAVDHHRPLLIVHAAGLPVVLETFSAPHENRKELRIAGRRVTDRGLRRVRESAPSLPVDVHMALGTAHDVLLDAAPEAHLLVVGSRGRGSIAAALLGSVSVDVSAHAGCPVVVVRPETDRARFGPYVGRVVVGVDGSEASMGALDMAFEMASTEYKPLAVLHSWGNAGVYRDLMSYETRLQKAEEHELAVAESIAGYAEKYPDVVFTQHQAEEDPGRTLVAASRDADTLVVGSRGRSDARSTILGSVSRYVVEHAHCPVIVVRRHP